MREYSWQMTMQISWKIAPNFLEPAFEVIRSCTGRPISTQRHRQAETGRPDHRYLHAHLECIQAAEKLYNSGSTVKIVFLTLHDDPDFIRASLAAGAMGYVIKARLAEELVFAVHEVLADRIFISPSLGRRK